MHQSGKLGALEKGVNVCLVHGFGIRKRAQSKHGTGERTMSVSKYAYTPEFCSGVFCIGDCDLCGLRDAEIDEEDEDVEED